MSLLETIMYATLYLYLFLGFLYILQKYVVNKHR